MEPFFPLILVSISWAIGMYFLAPRLGGNSWLWVVLTLIPLVNLFFMIYVSFTTLFVILDRLQAIQPGARSDT